MNRKLRHFLLTYDGARGRLRSVQSFHRADRAVAAYQAEEQNYSAEDQVQVVLVAADSLETVKKTHSNFWHGESVDQLIRDVIGAA